MSEFIFVPVVDLASSIARADAELALALRRGDRTEISRLELVLLNMRNLQKQTKSAHYVRKVN